MGFPRIDELSESLTSSKELKRGTAPVRTSSSSISSTLVSLRRDTSSRLYMLLGLTEGSPDAAEAAVDLSGSALAADAGGKRAVELRHPGGGSTLLKVDSEEEVVSLRAAIREAGVAEEGGAAAAAVAVAVAAAAEAELPAHLPGAEHWRIWGGDYDLTEFIAKHPGGETAIMLGRGRDCTRLFEQYHMWGENHRKVLERYAVRKAGSTAAAPEPVPSLPKDGPLVADFKALVRDYFGGVDAVKGGSYRAVARSHKASWSHIAMVAVFFAGMAWSAWMYLTGRSFVCGIVWPLMAWIFGSNVSHDSSHQAFSHISWVNELGVLAASPLVYGPSTWAAQHVRRPLLLLL